MHKDTVLVKVYAHMWPLSAHAAHGLLDALRPLFFCAQDVPLEEMLDIDKDMVRIHFEGVYFAIDELVECLTPYLTPQSQGKIDYIDLEAWTLTRYLISGTSLTSKTVPLNHVLDMATGAR